MMAFPLQTGEVIIVLSPGSNIAMPERQVEVKILIICFIIAVGLLSLSAIPASALEEDPARQILAEINLARTDPLLFAGFLHEIRGHFQGKSQRLSDTFARMETNEGVSAVDEAIEFLSRQKPLPPLVWSSGLAAAAAELTQVQGKSGAIGHGSGSSGVRQRIERHGTWETEIGESIVYDPIDPRTMVLRMIIDDGVPGRGHRKNQFNPAYDTAGIACGPHPRFDGVCVIDFSDRFLERVREE